MQVARSKASVVETAIDWCRRVSKTLCRMADCAGLGSSSQIFFFILIMKDEAISLHVAPSRILIFVG